MTKQNPKAKTSAARREAAVRTKSLRGIENCRVVDIGIGSFAECLKPGPATCTHALPFGYCFLCMHPRVDAIIENTKNQTRNGVLES
jgi:hypothetical protein